MKKRGHAKTFPRVDNGRALRAFEHDIRTAAFAACSVTAWKRVFLSVYRLDHLGGCAAGSVWYWPAHQKISKPLCFAIGEGRSLPKLSRKLPRSLTLIHPPFYPIASCSSHILSLAFISALYFIYRRQASLLALRSPSPTIVQSKVFNKRRKLE